MWNVTAVIAGIIAWFVLRYVLTSFFTVNQVNIIASTAEREAAIEFGKAKAMRPQIVGETLQRICADMTVADALFAILETQRLLDGKAQLTLLPNQDNLLAQLVAAQGPRVSN